jgi:hypothetical protein
MLPVMLEESSSMESDLQPKVDSNNKIFKKTQKRDVPIKDLKNRLICKLKW